MLLGKRPRAPMRRTTSMTEFSAGDLADEGAAIGDESRRQRDRREAGKRPPRSIQMRSENNLASMLETAQFLRACGLCKRRLGPGLDAFIYRGEIAFCSLECRQDLMNQDEKEEKCSTP
ncbi:FCS-Like Zinc finger 6-like [Typha angustifolia]|uniref:FCS-Like Zinc finger 6-like n=1 Tax=Typha angustifolia TaxID=59011 RepID=UPI003C2E0A9E